LALAAPTVLWSSNACVNFLNHHLAPAVSYATGGAGYLRWLLAGIVLLGAASLGLFGYFTGSASKLLTWQWVLLAFVWLLSTAAAWHFLRHLTQGELDFDGENWYFKNKVEQIDQVGTASVRFDGQNCLLLRFESEFKQISWLWLEAGFESDHWHDLRRAVYSRPALQNSLHLI
jgi:toxin CptA